MGGGLAPTNMRWSFEPEENPGQDGCPARGELASPGKGRGTNGS